MERRSARAGIPSWLPTTVRLLLGVPPPVHGTASELVCGEPEHHILRGYRASERRSNRRPRPRAWIFFRSLSTFKQGVRRLRDHYRRCRAAVRVRADGNATKAPREKRFLEAVGAGNFTFEGCFSSGALAVGLRGAHFASQGVWKFARNGAGSQGGRPSPFRGSLRRTVAISSRAESPVRVSDHAKPPPPSHAAAHLPPRPQF